MWLSYVSNKHDRCLPDWAGSYTETHVPLLGERVIPQLFEVLRPQVFVRVPGHCILTWLEGWNHKILMLTSKGNPGQERRCGTQALTADTVSHFIWLYLQEALDNLSAPLCRQTQHTVAHYNCIAHCNFSFVYSSDCGTTTTTWSRSTEQPPMVRQESF